MLHSFCGIRVIRGIFYFSTIIRMPMATRQLRPCGIADRFQSDYLLKRFELQSTNKKWRSGSLRRWKQKSELTG